MHGCLFIAYNIIPNTLKNHFMNSKSRIERKEREKNTFDRALNLILVLDEINKLLSF